MEGKKFDHGKPRMELLPLDALREVANVLTMGAVKYGDHNWREGMKWSRIQGALLRHLTAWQNGEDIDPESGLSHMAHVACNALFLLWYIITGRGDDDRYFIESPVD